MARSSLQFPPKSAENRKAANVCQYCRNKDWSAELAASKLRDGIVHLTIDKLEEAQKNGHDLTPKDMVRLWNALIDAACKEGCGCAQVLRQHIHCDELEQFWAATRIDLSGGEQTSKEQKKTKAKKTEAKEAPPPLPLGRHHAGNRRYKKNKARAKQAAAPTSIANPAQIPLPGPAPVTGLSNRAFGGLQALPIRLRAAPPTNPVQTVLGHPVTFVATLPTHTKTVPK